MYSLVPLTFLPRILLVCAASAGDTSGAVDVTEVVDPWLPPTDLDPLLLLLLVEAGGVPEGLDRGTGMDPEEVTVALPTRLCNNDKGGLLVGGWLEEEEEVDIGEERSSVALPG